MSKKKMSYIDVLKEAVNNYGHDTSDTVDVKGPFVDNILSYEGEGELTTYKDASSILERYYFDHDDGIEPLYEAHDPEPAGDDDGEGIDKDKEDIKKKVTEKEEDKEKDEEEEDDDDDEKEEVKESFSEVEKSIVEKLIEEMEGEDEEDEEEEKPNDKKKDKKNKDEEEEELDVDKELEEWGTGILEKEDEKEEDKEKDEEEEDDDDDEKEEDEEEEVEEKNDKKKVKKESGPTGGPLGKNKSSGIEKGQYKDKDDEDVIEENFELFKNKIMESDNDEKVEDIDSKDVIV